MTQSHSFDGPYSVPAVLHREDADVVFDRLSAIVAPDGVGSRMWTERALILLELAIQVLSFRRIVTGEDFTTLDIVVYATPDVLTSYMVSFTPPDEITEGGLLLRWKGLVEAYWAFLKSMPGSFPPSMMAFGDDIRAALVDDIKNNDILRDQWFHTHNVIYGAFTDGRQ